MKQVFIFATILLVSTSLFAQHTGSASVLSSAGRTSCEYVQLWENGPYWATFNVGATITDYAQLTFGAETIPYYNYKDQASYYNTANVGGLYAWKNPNLNGRTTTWTSSSISTGISDVATTLWGSNWKTPTKDQLDTLQNSDYGKTTWTWCDGNNTQYVTGCTLQGFKVSGVGDYIQYSIFLPAAGSFDYYDFTICGASYNGNYWQSAVHESKSDYAYYLDIFLNGRSISNCCREFGMSVRAVLADDVPTAVESVNDQVNHHLTKVISNCQLYILKDGKIFTIQGQEVK